MRRAAAIIVSLTLAGFLGTVLSARMSPPTEGWISQPLASVRALSSSLLTSKTWTGLPNLRGWLQATSDSSSVEAAEEPTVKTDRSDYSPGTPVVITGEGWQGDDEVRLSFSESCVVEGCTIDTHPDLLATVESDGTFFNSEFTPDIYDVDVSFTLTATGLQSGRTAETTFTDANQSANLDQCANDPSPSPSTDGCSASASDWVNGNLGASKSVYYEGDSIPYRLTFDNLTLASHTVIIEWDTTKSGKHAIDYLTTFNRTVATANPCLGVAGCGSPTTFPIPKDPQVDDGLGSPITQLAGNFTLYGGTITGVSSYSYANGTGFAGDKSARIAITFTASVDNPVLAWGGHIATRADWGLGNSAVAIPGSPYHTRLISLDGAGGNQDRSLSADAVVFPGSITIIKDAVPADDLFAGQDFSFTTTGGLSSFTLDDDDDPALSNTKLFSNITNFTTYTVSETLVTGWDLSVNNPVCTVTSANGGTQSFSSPTVTIDLEEGENVTCTFINTEDIGDTHAQLTVIKHVINDDGGTAVAGEWTMDVDGTPDASFLGDESGITVFLDPDTAYDVTESGGPSGYTASFSTDCSSTTGIPAGGSKTCTVTNDDNAAHLKLVKTVTNDNGGTAVATDFTLSASGPTPISGAGGAESDVSAGSYDLSETSVAGYTAGSWSCVGGTQSGASVALALGESATCTINNNDIQPTLTLVKTVINDNGGTKTVSDFPLFISGTPATSGVPVGLNAGTYGASETGQYGYTAGAWGGDCAANGAVTLSVGQNKTCTITNDDQPGTIVVIKNAKPAQGSFAFTTTTSDGSNPTLPDYADFTLTGETTNGGNQNSQTLDAGNYTVTEGTQLGWILTGIGGSTDPNTPYNCVVTGTGGSTGVGNLNTRTASISLKNGDTVTCTFENTGQGVTRTQGFWATHPSLANIAWFGGTAFGHTFPGVAGTTGIGDTLLCGRNIDTLAKLMGAFWSDVSKKSTGAKRTALDQARMQLLQQLIAAELNASAFGSVPAGGSGKFAQWEAAYCGTNRTAISNAMQQAAAFNNSGDSATFTPGTSADGKAAKTAANRQWWDVLP